MNDELLHKWLNNTLSPDELKSFKEGEDFAFNQQLIDDAQSFKARYHSAPKDFASLKVALEQTKDASNRTWLRPLLRVAAIFVLGFTLYFSLYYNTDLVVSTDFAQQTTITLPDSSTVIANANTRLQYSAKNWEDDRSIALNGEAFFKVAKGKKFDVVTSNGIVTVLGTQFTVTQRADYFNVNCYEGKVSVTYNDNQVVLLPGESYRVIQGKAQQYTQGNTAPSWTNNKSTFSGVPLWIVVDEFERQFGVSITTIEVNTNTLFNGAFTHNNLEQALLQITMPLELTYSINDSNSVTISAREP